MTDFNRHQVTVLLMLHDMDPHTRIRLSTEAADRHGEEADQITVYVPPGTGREARDRIWAALGTSPWQPENVGPHGAQDGDYIRRAYGSL